MLRPTKEDAFVLFQFRKEVLTPQMIESYDWFLKEFSAETYDEFESKYPSGSEGREHVSRILDLYEYAGVLVSHGLLNENLYFDMSTISAVWSKLEKIVAEMRKNAGSRLYENAVWLAEREKQWNRDVWRPDLSWKLQ